MDRESRNTSPERDSIMASDSPPKISKLSHGLAAIGSSGAWDLTIDESLDEEGGWEAELEGPNIYLSFVLDDLHLIRAALEYLQSKKAVEPKETGRKSATRGGLTLGRIGESKITLIWDDEDFDRCFIVVGPTGDSTIRLTLSGHDIKMLTGAFRKVIEQLSEDLVKGS
jgi:hypothetical protein